MTGKTTVRVQLANAAAFLLLVSGFYLYFNTTLPARLWGSLHSNHCPSAVPTEAAIRKIPDGLTNVIVSTRLLRGDAFDGFSLVVYTGSGNDRFDPNGYLAALKAVPPGNWVTHTQAKNAWTFRAGCYVGDHRYLHPNAQSLPMLLIHALALFLMLGLPLNWAVAEWHRHRHGFAGPVERTGWNMAVRYVVRASILVMVIGGFAVAVLANSTLAGLAFFVVWVAGVIIWERRFPISAKAEGRKDQISLGGILFISIVLLLLAFVQLPPIIKSRTKAKCNKAEKNFVAINTELDYLASKSKAEAISQDVQVTCDDIVRIIIHPADPHFAALSYGWSEHSPFDPVAPAVATSVVGNGTIALSCEETRAGAWVFTTVMDLTFEAACGYGEPKVETVEYK